MSFFGVQLNAQVNRLQLSRNKYMPNVRTIYKSFVHYDNSISGLIQSSNFEHALNQNRLFFKKYQIQLFFKAYNNQGLINWFDFLSHLKQPMGPLRRQLVVHIFDNIDHNKKGKVEVAELMSHFNVNQIEAYRTGKRSQAEVKEQFLTMLVAQQGYITKQQFIAFYDDLNINFAHNDIFARYVSSQWHYTPQKLQAVKQEQVKVAIKNLRYRLIEKSQGTKDELLIKKLFDEYDNNGTAYLGPYNLDQMMQKLGVAADPSVTEAVFEAIDKNNSGYIQFEEFKKFLYYDPYPY